eukprot:Hpha_TRINITY_DN15892_c0_g7::TRINITY_DN15892_c0_g7_i1::g.187293::m.187293/K18466/VPS26; vacuolar protein sorting-associated protein 26
MPQTSAKKNAFPPKRKNSVLNDRGQLLGFGTPVELNVTIADAEDRKRVDVAPWMGDADAESQAQRTLYTFEKEDRVAGEIIINTDAKQRVEYQELTVSLVGQMTTLTSEGRIMEEFVKKTMVLKKGRKLVCEEVDVFQYAFEGVPKVADSYYGSRMRVRWLLRVAMRRNALPDVIEEEEIWVENPSSPGSSGPMRAEVGVENCLHIEFEFDKRAYHLRDTVHGVINFHMVQGIKLRSVELTVVCRETIGSGRSAMHFARTVGQLEVMDGHPTLEMNVPMRLQLGAYPLTQTINDPELNYGVRYFLNLILLDSNDRRYYKQQEVQLFRRPRTNGPKSWRDVLATRRTTDTKKEEEA